MFESEGTTGSKDRARTLILAMNSSTETDLLSCFPLFLNILKSMLPSASRDALLTRMRRAIPGNLDSALVSVSQPSQSQSFPGNLAISQELASRNPLLGKL